MTLEESLATDRDPDAEGYVRWYYRVGIVVWPAFTAWIVRSEAAGVTVCREHRRGVLVREGWIRLEGCWRDVSGALRQWRQLEGNTNG